MKTKWKILLVCAVALAGIAAWCFVPRTVAEGAYRVYYVAAGEGLRNVTDQVDLEAGVLRLPEGDAPGGHGRAAAGR